MRLESYTTVLYTRGMTVIMGINLSDRLYIAGDTRVSKKEGDKIVPQHDNVQKVEHLKNGIVIASAGHAGLAKHILNRLRKATFVSIGIDATRRDIEEWIKPVADWYWQKQGKADTHATFIIGGKSSARKRILDKKLLNEMQNSIFNDEEARRQTLGMNSSLFSALANTPGDVDRVTLATNDLVMFAISVDYRGVSIQDTGWGEHLLFGSPGLIKEDVKPVHIARLEFMNHSKDSDNGMMLITAYFSDMVKSRKLEGVGSTVLAASVQSAQSYLMTGTVYAIDESSNPSQPFTINEVSSIEVIDDVIYRVEHGAKYPLTPVSNYESDDVAALSI